MKRQITDKEIFLHLRNIQQIICEAAEVGFNPQEGFWADKMFATNQMRSNILEQRTGHYAGKTLGE